MPNENDYDMDYRPESYWGISEDISHIGVTVKGELRRRAAKELAEEGVLEPVISVESLSFDEREAAGRVHPWFMGGEYLPDIYPSEVEIARVTMKSTTLDIISIRARRTKHRIKYRIVDEYFDDPIFDYHLIQKSSVKPLTMKQLIRLIDNAQERGLNGEARYHNYVHGDSDPENLYDFAIITSEYYSELEDWYDTTNQEWLDKELERISELQEAEEFDESSIVEETEEQRQQRLQQIQDFEKKVEASFKKAKWRFGCGMGGAAGVAHYCFKIRGFIEQHIKENGVPPIGTFRIEAVEVEFFG